MCVCACGRSSVPPRVWQSLWCSDIVVAASTAPHSQAPYWASPRASRSAPSATTRGSAAASARTPSSAISETIGVASGA